MVYLFKTTFVLIAGANVSETQAKLRMISLITIHKNIFFKIFKKNIYNVLVPSDVLKGSSIARI